MTRVPYRHASANALYVGDARDVLADMPDGSADCIGTSPPYWGKRDFERKFTDIELSPDFARLAAKRLSGPARSERGPV